MNASSEAVNELIPEVLTMAVQRATCETFTKISGHEALCKMADYQKIEGIFGSISFTGERAWRDGDGARPRLCRLWRTL